MKRLFTFVFRKFLRLLCSINTKRTAWLLIDNTFNNTSEPVDNFTLFEYLIKNTKENVFYVMPKTHIRYIELKRKYGSRILNISNKRLTFSFILHLARTKYILDSFQVLSNKFNIGDILCVSKIHYIYTQHGINFFKTGFIEKSNVISDENFSEIVCSSKSEAALLNRYFNYPASRIIYSGLARWDKVTSKRKYIFIYFTFRSYLLKSGSDRKDCLYYKNIRELATNQKLKEICRKNNIKLCFALHHETERFTADLYNDIHFVNQNDIGKIKNEAALLVTDYSSMCFDFMVKNKPVIFFRLDKNEEIMDEESFSNNLNIERLNDKICNVVYDVDHVIDLITKYIINGFEISKEENGKNNAFFTIRDNICFDLYKQIKNLKITNLYDGIKTPIGKLIPISRTKEIRCIGLSKPEKNGRWSVSDQVFFYFNIKNSNEDRVISFDLFSITDIDCKIELFGNDLFIGNVFKDPRKNKINLLIPGEIIKNRKGRIKLRFRILMPIRPCWIYKSKETRYLGIFFRSVKVL